MVPLVVLVAVAVLAAVVAVVVRLRAGRRSRVAVALTAVSLLVAVAAGGAAVLDTGRAAAAGRAADALAVPTARWRPAEVHSGPGYAGITRLSIPVVPAALRAGSRYESALAREGAPRHLPATGLLGSVVIPATRSHFVARPAVVYLPPAALVPRPESLPVVIAFSGQSPGAGPNDVALKLDLARTMNAVAAAHQGVAPIVVAPDQLGPATGNPMCVDSRHFGNVATYVTTDVRQWILTHLPVRTDRRGWTVAGFSEGGTCAIQFGAANPSIFGSIVDISGERTPTNGTLAHTIAVGWGGDRAAYLRATPFRILARHHYTDEQAYFAVGALDKHYGPVAPVMAARARAAGMTTHFWRIPHDAHWSITGAAGLKWALGSDSLADWWGLPT